MKKSFFLNTFFIAVLFSLYMLLAPSNSYGQCVANAGPDKVICNSINNVILSGFHSGGTSVQWTTSGSGSFSNPNADSTWYNLSASDIASGTIAVILKVQGTCTSFDTAYIIINPSPVVDAGPNQTICGSDSIFLSSTVSQASGVKWTTTGTGFFIPNNTSTNPIYSASAADKANGSVYFSIQSTGNGGCNPATDSTVVFFNQANQVYAGADTAICDQGPVYLNATHFGTGSFLWTSSGTGSFSNTNSKNTIYSPTASDIANGFVNCTVIVSGGGCPPASDVVKISFTNLVTVTAYADTMVCKGQDIHLYGTVSGASGGLWTSNGSGIFSPSSSSLIATYIASVSDVGSLNFTLTSTGGCGSNSSSFITNIFATPQVEAGSNQVVCENSTINLSGSTTGSSVFWSGSGTGTFSSTTNLNTLYNPSLADIAKGSVGFSLMAVNGFCTHLDSVFVTIKKSPLAFAGPDQVVSSNATTIQLNGIIANATGGIWTSTGSGMFSPNNNLLMANYIPAVADISSGAVTLTLTTTGNGVCNPVTSNMNISFINQSLLFTLGGQISAGSSPLNNGTIIIYKFSENTLNLVKSILLKSTDNGNYNFTDLTNGNYIIHAIPGSNVSNYKATFFGNATDWNQASKITITDGNISGKNINLNSFLSTDPTWNTGNDTISGSVLYAGEKLRTEGLNTPVGNAVVTLYNSNNEPLAQTYTDATGNYIFKGVKAGNYYVIIEYPGAQVISSEQLSVDGNPNTTTIVSGEINKVTVVAGENSASADVYGINIFPNPASNYLRVSSSIGIENAEIEIMNSNGIIVHKENISSLTKDYQLEISTLPEGIYLLNFKQSGKNNRSKFIKKN